jgi:hypothetical protein
VIYGDRLVWFRQECLYRRARCTGRLGRPSGRLARRTSRATSSQSTARRASVPARTARRDAAVRVTTTGGAIIRFCSKRLRSDCGLQLDGHLSGASFMSNSSRRRDARCGAERGRQPGRQRRR